VAKCTKTHTNVFNTRMFALIFHIRCIQHFPQLFIQSEVFSPTVVCSLSAATLDHRDAFMSVMKFFKALLACPYTQKVSTNISVLCSTGEATQSVVLHGNVCSV